MKLCDSLQHERFACTLAHRATDSVPMVLASTDTTRKEHTCRELER
jgi:hypothetical protein